MNESQTSWLIVAAILWTGLTDCGFAQITQTSSVADGMGTRSTGGSYTHIGAGGQPGGIATAQGGSYYNQAGFLNTFFLKPGLDTDGNGIPDEADWDNDGDLLADLDEILGAQFSPTSPTNPNNIDSDNDGMSDYQEMIAGTDPNNPDALLEIISIISPGGNRIVEWTARSNKTYRLVQSDHITQTPTNVIAQVTATGPASPPWYVTTASSGDFVAPTNQGFYAVEVLP